MGKEILLALLARDPPLVEGLIAASEQVQPNGIDLTLQSVARFPSYGELGAAAQSRVLPEPVPLDFAPDGFLELLPHCYLITFNEIVHIPGNMMALGKPRSSLLRSGVSIETAVWDAGYSGRSQALMVVHNPFGFRLQRNARVMQLVFFTVSGDTFGGYSGRFQSENL